MKNKNSTDDLKVRAKYRIWRKFVFVLRDCMYMYIKV